MPEIILSGKHVKKIISGLECKETINSEFNMLKHLPEFKYKKKKKIVLGIPKFNENTVFSIYDMYVAEEKATVNL